MGRIQSLISLKSLFIILLIALTAFTHLFRIDHTYIFHNDEARDVLIVKKMWDSKTPILLGPQTSIGNMYLGPIYYYMITPALLFSNFDPVGPAVLVALFAVATTLLLFFFGTRWYGFTGGAVAALFYALSPVMIHYSRSSWNPNLVPFFSLILLATASSRSRFSWFLFGLIAGIIFQLHYVALTLVVLVALVKLYNKFNLYDLLLGLAGFLLTSSPFWLFEIRHNWVNIQAFYVFLTNPPTQNVPASPYLSRLVANFILFVKGVIGSSTLSVQQLPSFILLVGGLLSILAIFRRSSRQLSFYLFGTIIVVSILKEPLNIHYLAHLFPVACLLLGSLANSSRRFLRYGTIIFSLYLVCFFVPTLKYNLFVIDSVQPVRARELATYIIERSGGKPYNIVGTAGTYTTPVEYYLSLSSTRPSTTITDLIFNICENGPCPDNDLHNPNLLASGPTHPAIAEYLGHPQMLDNKLSLSEKSNEPVSYGTYIATYQHNPDRM